MDRFLGDEPNVEWKQNVQLPRPRDMGARTDSRDGGAREGQSDSSRSGEGTEYVAGADDLCEGPIREHECEPS